MESALTSYGSKTLSIDSIKICIDTNIKKIPLTNPETVLNLSYP
jgi:hypothetical protein